MHFMRLASTAFLFFLSATRLDGQSIPLKSSWEQFQFLVGKWTATGSGQPGAAATGGFTFGFDLEKNILMRRNWAKYPPKAGEKVGINHEDLMIIYPDAAPGKFRAIYFDNEAHVINYTVSFPAKQPAVTFESDNSQPGPQYRLTYELDRQGQIVIAFLIATAPGQEFREYTRGTARRVK